MPEVVLNSSRVVAIARQSVTSGVTQHVCMNLERKARFLSRSFHQPIEAIRREWSTTLAHEHKR